MYRHKGCETPAGRNNDGLVDGIYLSGYVPVSFNQQGGRTFAFETSFHNDGIVHSITCLDCDKTLWDDVRGADLREVEYDLEAGSYPEVEWVES